MLLLNINGRSSQIIFRVFREFYAIFKENILRTKRKLPLNIRE